MRILSWLWFSPLPAGIVPTSSFLNEVDVAGEFHPFSATFSIAESTESYDWVSQIPQFSEEQLTAASAVPDLTYTQVPEGLPARIMDLALQVTRGHASPCAKAKALELHLSTQYTYRYADSWSSGALPPGTRPRGLVPVQPPLGNLRRVQFGIRGYGPVHRHSREDSVRMGYRSDF